MTTEEVVKKYFEAVNAGDWETWLSLFDDNIVLIEPIGTAEGIETLKQGVEGLKKGYANFQNNLLGMVVQGNEAVAFTQIEATTAGGKPVQAQVANHYTVKNSKIVRQQNYLDSKDLEPFLKEQGLA